MKSDIVGRLTPFPKLPSLLISATILSYLDYDYKVEQILNLLSKISG